MPLALFAAGELLEERIVNAKDTAQTGPAVAHLTGASPNYMQLAGTNIEDFDRAMRRSAVRPQRAAASEQTDAEVTA
jgi:hypothetical protein